MGLNQLFQSFVSFNINAFNNLAYIFWEKKGLFIIAICAIASMTMLLKEEVEYIAVEEQNIL